MKKQAIRKQSTCLLIIGSIAGYAAAQGSLTPPEAPSPTMHTLEEIYQKLTNTLAEVQTTQQEVLANQQRLSEMEQRLVSGGMQITSGSMVLVPAGDFVMGDTFGDGFYELPLHTNTISAFYMDETETTKAKWDTTYNWATNNGYGFDNPGAGKETDHPVQMVNWYDGLKWANARSEMNGFEPCYTNGNGTVYTNGTFAGGCNWSATGYRLPTEAEWEKAARGGVANRRFPWDDVNIIRHTRANYYAEGGFSYDDSDGVGYHPDYVSGGMPYTSPVGSFAANGYGLYDMAGNVYEWCWDRYGNTYYASSPSSNPHGPGSGSDRVMRGGRWSGFAYSSRIAGRNYFPPGSRLSSIGFRLVRAAP